MIRSQRPVRLRHLGRMDYQPVWRAMQAYTDARDDLSLDEVWWVEHPPVFTQGLNGKAEHLLAPGDIPVVQVDRGGQVTYHGPGQVVLYLLLDIKRAGMGVRDLVSRIEQAIIDLLAESGIASEARADAPGVYVAGAKIASVGLRIRRGRSFHGLSLNVAMDLAPFARINTCGYPGLTVTQLSALTAKADYHGSAERLIQLLTQRLELAPLAQIEQQLPPNPTEPTLHESTQS